MKLASFESCVLAGLDAVSDLAQTEPVPKNYIGDPVYETAVLAAQNFIQPISEREHYLVSAFFHNVNRITRFYARSALTHFGTWLDTFDHTTMLHAASPELLRVAEIGDDDREDVFNAADQQQRAAWPVFDFQDNHNGLLLPAWNSQLSKMIADSPEATGCPARTRESAVEPSKSILEHFFNRYVGVLGARTISHETAVTLGGLSLAH